MNEVHAPKFAGLALLFTLFLLQLAACGQNGGTAVLFASLANFIPQYLREKQQQQILAATVMISITTPNWQQMVAATEEALPIPSDEYRRMARANGDVVADGLGTLVAYGDETLLVTHDHWSRFDELLGTVTFWAADGVWLAEMDLRVFKRHLRYRDGGTMVLTAPDMLAMAVSGKAEALKTNDLRIGDSVILVQRDGNRIVLTEANVVAQSDRQARLVVRLQSADGQVVVGGDSGGGVWANGRLAATMWTTVMMENVESGERRATDVSVAAVFDHLPRNRIPGRNKGLPP